MRAMRYKVMVSHGRGSEQLCAQFKEISDARLFVDHKITADAALKINTIYCLYDTDELLSEHHTATAKPADNQPASSGAGGAQGQGSSATFKPTPFNMAPRPTGVPQKWNKYKDDDDDEKK